MRSLTLCGLALASALSILAGARPAHACKCSRSEVTILLPRDGAQDVPTNTRVLLSAELVGAGRWLAADATATLPDLQIFAVKRQPNGTLKLRGKALKATVSATMSEVQGSFLIVTPGKPLAARTTYALVHVTGKKPADRTIVSTFTTAMTPDTSAPAFAGLEELVVFVDFRRRLSDCDGEAPFEQVSWKHGPLEDDRTAAEDLLRIFYLQRKGEPRQARTIDLPGGARVDARLTDSVCDPFHVKVKPGEEWCASVEVVDLSGNAVGSAVERCMVARGL